MYYDAIEEIENNVENMIDPNTVIDFDYNLIATFNSLSDVDNFCITYNHSNNYNGLMVGNRIQINDGTYNKAWYIAGFDCEYNKQANDGTTYDNGYGICLVPEHDLLIARWYSSSTTGKSYIQSTIHTTTLPTVANNLKNVLGNHLINRNVLLSSRASSDGYESALQWTTSYATLMSRDQIEITADLYYSGEANYFLPLFRFMACAKYIDISVDKDFLSRNLYGMNRDNYCVYGYHWPSPPSAGWNSAYSYYSYNYYMGIRPLIYIR